MSNGRFWVMLAILIAVTILILAALGNYFAG
jgi:hypothetical protein